MQSVTTVTCPFCGRPRIEFVSVVLAAADYRRAAACGAICWQAYMTDLRTKLRWDISWMFER